MFYYYLPVILQIYCFYHAYRNGKEIYWYALIFFIPLVGSIIYLLIHVLNKKDAQVIGEEISTAINPSKKIKDLNNKVQFSDTFANRVALADAYFDKKEYESALEQYHIALDGAHLNDSYVKQQLVIANYENGNYEEVIKIGKSLNPNSKQSALKTEFYVGLSYKSLGKYNNAEKHLKNLDVRYSNYKERQILAEFYLERDKKELAKEMIEELLAEYNHMSKPNKRLNRNTFTQINKLHKSLT